MDRLFRDWRFALLWVIGIIARFGQPGPDRYADQGSG